MRQPNAAIPNIPVVFPDQFPAGYPNTVASWGNFDSETVKSTRGKLLMLDIDYGDTCSNNCPSCFRRLNLADEGNIKPLTEQQLRAAILEAKALGLRMVKFLGRGEPTEEPGLLGFLEFLCELGISSAIFTKGHVIGNDDMARKVYGMSGEELARRLYELNASILLGFNSFIPEVQDQMMGVHGRTLERNRALEIFVETGFNSTTPTRLALCANPVTPDNISEAFDIYEWARRRNMYAVVCPTMIAGLARDNWAEITPSEDELVELYTRIYQFNLEYGLQTREQLRLEGLSAYAGGHPCNQIAKGMYLTLNGTVLRCPGDDVFIFGRYPEQSIAEIWHDNQNCARGEGVCFNCLCAPKDGKSIPFDLYHRVSKNLGIY